MAIRRISDLPSLGTDEALSNCVIEVSYKDDDNSYKSRYTYPSNIANYTINQIENNSFNKVTIEGDLTITDGTVNINNPEYDTNIHSQNINLNSENDIDIDAKNQVNIKGLNGINIDGDDSLVSIKGNPVVINDNLSVYDALTQTNNPVAFTNPTNQIKARTIGVAEYTSNLNQNEVVTCGLLAATVGAAVTSIFRYSNGEGI